MTKRKIICIDARLWGSKHTGIGRYVENLIDYLPVSNCYEVILIVSPELKHEPKLKSFTKYYAKYHPYSLFAQIEILCLLAIIKPDLIHTPHFTIPILWTGKQVVTIHDLIKHFSKGTDTTTRHKYVYWLKYMGYILITYLAIKRADHIIVPAVYWKKIISKKYNVPLRKISVTYEGVPAQYLNPHFSPNYKPPLPKPFLVYTGNLYPHKNLPTLFKAIKLLKGNINLAIVCARSVFTKRVEELINKEHLSAYVKFLGYVPDSDLINLYSQSLALVQPSLIEGFGLTGLEAMAVNTPVIAARASCLPEVYQQAALFFKPLDAVDLSRKISLLLSDENKRTHLISKGRELLRQYSWGKMSSQTRDIYLQILKA